jgi:putative tryptophan/tyrosine transport system substrate-binding protein
VKRRRALFVIAGAVGLLPALPHAGAQTAATLRRVGILHVASDADGATMRTPFKQGMQELGWHEGKNIEYRVLAAGGDAARLEALARELVAQGAEVIVAPTSSTTRAALRATTTLPIVMTGVGDPVAEGFVASLARPGGNVTGISNQAAELMAKLVQLVHEVVPLARRVAVLLNHNNPTGAPLNRAAAQRACAALDLTPVWVAASAPAELAGAVEQLVVQRPQAVVVPADAMYYSERVRLHALLLARGLPAAYGHRENVVAGGLLGYTSNYVANFRYAAKFVDKILKGARPADLPIEQPTTFELIVNLKTAKALGVVFPQSVLLRANEVIE